ncbi:unnamed protein product [Miscanthus lutarioriparius]|uniref:Uncharacterized protein n=1 Tax=Miscanthus lutarioriparius TaxID=422564 RepID=A0A811R9F6_9POAL|nr:unnamed protein product [Miscanthus lutarioriparius]
MMSAEIPVEMADASSTAHCPQITQGGNDLDLDQDASYDEESDGRDQLKDAIERYTLKMKIVTYDPNHACCPELKNKRLSTTRICEKYESTVKANPSWKARALKETVQDIMGIMGVDVSITIIKRVKTKVMDSQSGEYSKLFDYALELKRSNPGTSVHIALDPEEDDHVFQGSLDGCRRVLGLLWNMRINIRGVSWSSSERYQYTYWRSGWVFITDQQKETLAVRAGGRGRPAPTPPLAVVPCFRVETLANDGSGGCVDDEIVLNLLSLVCSCMHYEILGSSLIDMLSLSFPMESLVGTICMLSSKHLTFRAKLTGYGLAFSQDYTEDYTSCINNYML